MSGVAPKLIKAITDSLGPFMLHGHPLQVYRLTTNRQRCNAGCRRISVYSVAAGDSAWHLCARCTRALFDHKPPRGGGKK